jgi:hypothetical protein
MGGTYESSNVIRVNVAMHAFLHKFLWDEHGRWQDKIAWHVLAGMISKEQARVAAVSEMGKERWANDAVYRAKMKAVHSVPSESASITMKSQWANSSFRSRVAAGQKQRWADPKERQLATERMRGNKRGLGYRHSSEELAKISTASRSQWASFSDEKRAAIISKRVAARLRNRRVH